MREFRANSLHWVSLVCLAPASGQTATGVTLGAPKVFDNRTLNLMLERLNSQLAGITVIDQKSLGLAIGTTQGSQLEDSSSPLDVQASFMSRPRQRRTPPQPTAPLRPRPSRHPQSRAVHLPCPPFRTCLPLRARSQMSNTVGAPRICLANKSISPTGFSISKCCSIDPYRIVFSEVTSNLGCKPSLDSTFPSTRRAMLKPPLRWSKSL